MELRDLIVPLCGLVLSGLLGVFFSAGVGILLALLFLALGGAIPFLPPFWKINMRIALRNIGRRPMRSTMLMLILFVGVFVIGGIQVIGQDLQNQLTTAINQVLSYNVVAKVSQDEASTMQAQLPALSGLLSSYSTTVAPTSPITINGQPWQSFFSTQNASQTLEPRVLHNLDGVEGYDLAQQKFPDPHTFQIMAGRNLNASDAHTNNVLIPYTPPTLANTIPLNVGSTLTVASTDGKTHTTLTVVGEYTLSDIWFTTVSPILTDQQIVRTLAPAGEQTIFYLKVNPAQVPQAETHIENSVPNVSFVQTPASRVNDYLTGLSSIVWTFTALASFVLLAGIIIMANAVILDLLERRRELGILKAIGYTQKTLQGEILLEYGII